jgi:hypothetical protein
MECVVLVRKAAEEIRGSPFLYLRAQKINELVVTSKKLTNNFAGLVTAGLGPDMARGPPVGPRCCLINLLCDMYICT